MDRGRGRGRGRGHGKNGSRSRSRSNSGGKHGGHGGQQYQGGQYQGQFQGAQRPADDTIRNQIRQLIMRHDKDGNGKLVQAQFQTCIGELCQRLNQPHPTSYQQFVEIAKSIDKNYDGAIDQKELYKVFMRFMYGVDA